jgi:2-iminobutanoate/2-iminopropanoate deaminase
VTKFLNPSDAPDFTKFGLSLGASTGDMVWAAGMALDTEKGERLADADTVANETRICLRQIESCLHEVGATLTDVVKTTCYLAEQSYRGEFMDAYREFFPEGKYPSRCTFVAGIAGNCRVEIEATAVKGAGARDD